MTGLYNYMEVTICKYSTGWKETAELTKMEVFTEYIKESQIFMEVVCQLLLCAVK